MNSVHKDVCAGAETAQWTVHSRKNSDDALTASGAAADTPSPIRHMICTVSKKKIWYPPFAIVFTRDRCHKLFFFNPQSGRENRQWPPFQLGGVARVTTPFKKKRKGPCHSTRFLSCLPQNVSWHKSPRTRISALPQHCQQMWPPFFFSLPLLKKGKKKEKLNSPLPCQLK